MSEKTTDKPPGKPASYWRESDFTKIATGNPAEFREWEDRMTTIEVLTLTGLKTTGQLKAAGDDTITVEENDRATPTIIYKRNIVLIREAWEEPGAMAKAGKRKAGKRQ